MKRLALILLALAHPLFAAVTIAPVVPTYSYQVLPGSTRQVAVIVASPASPCGPTSSPACTGTVTWTVSSTTGGASANFSDITHTAVSSITGGLATMLVNIGSTAGTCSISPASGVPGGIGTYHVTSTATVTVTATSTDSGTPATTFILNVCAKTTSVIVVPAYQQAYQTQKVSLQSWVTGDTDETGTWSCSGPGTCTLADTTNRDTLFSATVTGRYVLTYTSHSNGSKTATAIVYVSPNAMPSYAVTPDGTVPRECYHDPALTGGDYEVGSGYTYATPIAVPAWATWAAGTIERIHNTGGGTPTVYTNYMQVEITGTATQPMIVCGMDDSGAGHLPILDGTNATTQSGTSTALDGFGIIFLWPGPTGGHFGRWQAGSAGPSYVSITGLHLKNANPGKNFVPPGGGSSQWIDGAGGVYLGSGSNIDIAGNFMDSDSNGVFTAANAANNGWSTLTQDIGFRGNHVTNAGWSTEFQEHDVYYQSWWGLIEGNLLDHMLPTAQGACIKDRGVETIIRYNYCQSDPSSAGPTRIIDHVERQDSGVYMSFEAYLSFPGDTNCNNSFWCLADTAGADIVAGYQESAQKSFDYGNALTNAGQTAEFQIHYGEDHDGGMEAQNGTLYSYSNTIDNAEIVYDNTSNNNGVMYLQQRVRAQNNILYNTAFGKISFNNFEPLIFTGLVNLTPTNTSITTPILGGSYNAGTTTGWQAGCDLATCPWNLTNPLNTHIYNLTSGNYPTTGTTPYASGTLVPGSGSPAVGAGVALTAPIDVLPVRYQFNIATGALMSRVFPLTLGSQDQSGGTPTVATPTFSPIAGTYGSTQTVTITTSTGGATLCYTTDGSTPTATTPGTCSHGTTYTTPVTVSSSLTLNAIGTEASFINSSVGSAAYVISTTASTPTFSPPAGTYSSTQTVTISTTSPGAIICTSTTTTPVTNGTTGCTTGTLYTGPITVSVSETLHAVAGGTGYADSSPGTAAYVINPVASTPTFSPVAGTYGPTQNVTISTLPAAIICYNTTGSPHTNGTAGCSVGTLYTSPVSVSVSETLFAVAGGTGYTDSAVGSAAYVINGPVADPTCSPIAGAYGPTQSVTCSSSTAGSTTVCTIDGSTPTHASPVCTAISVTTTLTLKALSFKSLFADSSIISNSYTINGAASTPTYSPVAGTYTSAQSVTLSTASSGCGSHLVWNTTNAQSGGNLTGTSSTNPLNVSSTETVYSQVQSCPTYINSSIASALYTITGTVANPTCSPVAGTYTGTQSVTCSSSTGGSTTVCTIDGSTPTHGSPACSAISVGSSLTLKALSFETAWIDSAVTPFVYTITGTVVAPTFSPPAGAYSSTQSVVISTVTGGASVIYTVDGSTPTVTANTCTITHGTLYTGPVSVSSSQTINALGCESTFAASSVASATYTINPAAAIPTFSPVAGTYVGTQNVTISTTSPGAILCYNLIGAPATNGTTGCSVGTLYTAPVGISTISTIYAVAGGTGYTDSAVGLAAYIIAAAAPTFSPVAGTYVGTQTVTLSTSTVPCTGGAVLWNLTNAQSGGNLTGTSSGAVTVAASETIYGQVQGCSGLANSSISNAAYIINAIPSNIIIQGGVTLSGGVSLQ